VTAYRFNQHNKMTKVIILGEQPEKKELKPIEFVKYLTNDNDILNAYSTPDSYANIELICRNYNHNKHDLMFAFNEHRNGGCLYLGYFNDGIV
jgi:hypothetical protein